MQPTSNDILPRKLFFTRKEAAEWLRTSQSTLDVWIGRGDIHPIHYGRNVLIPRDEVIRVSKLDLAGWPEKLNGKTRRKRST
jgi:excisionase family DNA binding protein